MLLLSNLIVLGGLELGARLLGIGYPTRFFSKESVKGRDVINPNHQFFWSFFPKALSRSPQPIQFSPRADENTTRIFLFGESAAMGDPEPAFGMARLLELVLERRHPDRKFEVINLAVTAINSHVILPIAREAANYDGDFWCVYMGNNEVHGQFGPGTVFGQSEANLKLIRSSLAVKRTRIGQMANLLGGALSSSDSTDSDWAGMAMFDGQHLFADDDRLQAVYDNYRANLADITEAGIQSGAEVLLSNVAVNLADSSPFISIDPKSLPAVEHSEWEANYQAGQKLFEAGLTSDAIPKFEAAAEILPAHAETEYLLGRCHWALNDFKSAQKYFYQALDHDGLRFRTDTKLNQLIRTFAEGHASERVHFVNSEALVAYNTPTKIPGDEIFWDHVHLRFPGSYLVALAFAQQIESILFPNTPTDGLPPWINLSECAQALALTRWSDYQMTSSMRQRLAEEPFRSQSVFRLRNQRLQTELQGHLVGISPEAFTIQQPAFTRHLESEPGDYVLRDLYARYLLSSGRTDEAISEWKIVIDQVPSHLMAHYQIGEALNENPNRAAEAEASLRRALGIRPDTVNITVALGQSLLTQRQHAKALKTFQRALALRSNAIEGIAGAFRAAKATGDNLLAKEYLDQARAIAPDHPSVQALTQTP